jgi:cytoskeletal protein RodZ
MTAFTVPALIPLGTVLNANINGVSQELQFVAMAAIQVTISGTPTGTFSLQSSCDPVNTGQTQWPINWTTISGTSTSVTASGNIVWNLNFTGYNWVRIQYSDSSSGTSTATVTQATFVGKGA